MKKWYEELFENYAEEYKKLVFTQGTIGEVDFLEQEINFNKQTRILDIGCGIGRHSLELFRRGYENVTGIDLSESLLNKAIECAKDENMNINFIRMNALDMDFHQEFDLAIILCGGAFPLMETDEMNFKILQGMSEALKPGGKFILTTLNALYPLTHNVGEFIGAESSKFDHITLRHNFEIKKIDDSGKESLITGHDRFFVPTEIRWYLKTLEFNKIEFCGAKLGAYSRKDALTNEDFEMLVVAEK